MYILKVYSIHYWDKTQMFKKNYFGKKKQYKKYPFFFLRAPTHDSFIFNLQFLYELTHTRFVSLKLCVGFAIFVFIKVYIFVQKYMGSLVLNYHNSFQH